MLKKYLLFLFSGLTFATDINLSERFEAALENANAATATTNCQNVPTSAARGASTLASEFKDHLWGSVVLKWQFCAKTNLQFEKWKPKIENSLQKTLRNQIQIKKYTKTTWLQWNYCHQCYVQSYLVTIKGVQHEVWVEYHKYEFFEGAVTVWVNDPGGFIRVGAIY